jgi:predicted nucleic acid-binding protein
VIVLDASVLIAHLDADDALHQRASTLLRSLAQEQFVASALTVAEVLVAPARAGALERAGAVLRRLGVDTVPLLATSPATLAGLRAATGLKLPDCWVLLAAQEVGAGLATFDDRLAAAARHRGVPVHD